jgi:hypothetical protein
MNSSLKPRTNIILCIAWEAAFLVCFAVSSPRPYLLALLASLSGVAAGHFQQRAIRDSPAAFKEARSLLDVRKVMTSSVAGKNAIWILWINFIGVIVWNWPPRPQVFGSILCGILAFNFAGDLSALPTIFWLARDKTN